MILAVTGHRPPKVGGYDIQNPVFEAVAQSIDEALVRLQPDLVITGMALGVDQWAASICVMNEIPFVAAIPFDGYDSKWPDSSREEFRRLLRHAREVHVVSPGAPYDPRLLQTRNIWMVRRADVLLAVHNGSPGGTANCIRAAQNHGKQICFASISPDVWALARQIEERMNVRTMQRQQLSEDVRYRRDHLDNLAAEGRASRRRRAAPENLVEAAEVIPPDVPKNVSEEMARMREELDRRLGEATKMSAELLDKDRAERIVVEQARTREDAADYNDKTMPKRLIEVGEDL